MKTMRSVALCALVCLSPLGCSSGGGGAGNGNTGGLPNGSSGSGGGSSPGGASGSSSGGSGSGSSSGGSGSGGGNGNSSGSSSGASSSGSGGGSSSSDAGIAAGDAAIDPDVAYSVTLTMDAFTVGAGQEVFMCQDFANPFKGQQADIKTYELHMAQGSHHMFAFYKSSATNSSVVKCPQGGLQFAPFTFSAQSPDVVQTYPQGVGATIPPTTGFTLNAHYINAGSAPITGNVSLTMYVAKPGIITLHAGVLFLNQISLRVPATATTAQPYTSSAKYTLPQDVYIMWSNSHMHQRATNFVATASSGQTLFQSTQWAEPPPAVYSPPVHLTSGTSITWSCTYVNNTGQALTFGEFAATNVMCISTSIFYPVQDPANPVISAML